VTLRSCITASKTIRSLRSKAPQFIDLTHPSACDSQGVCDNLL
jgi:hypothetical protein